MALDRGHRSTLRWTGPERRHGVLADDFVHSRTDRRARTAMRLMVQPTWPGRAFHSWDGRLNGSANGVGCKPCSPQGPAPSSPNLSLDAQTRAPVS